MFDFLKKKVSNFTDKLKEKLQKQESKKETEQIEKPKPVQEQKEQVSKPVKEKPIIEQEVKEVVETKEETVSEEEITEEPTEPKAEESVIEKEISEPEIEEEKFSIGGEDKAAEEKVKEIRKDEKRELKAKVGLGKKLFGFIGGKIKITEKEAGEFFEEFELSLLESDVEQDTAEAIVKELKERLIGKEISAKEDVGEFLKKEVKGSLEKIMETEKINLLSLKEKPLKILFLGPNGAGKTTSIAKISKYFMNNKKSVILAAGDTFRAAAIDQLEEHGKKLGVKVVKHKYGSDPTAVAFDAVKAAEAKNIDVVLIDSAGRQDTNKNLIDELKKIERVIKPDVKLYVGEAYTGQALLQQASEFDKAIGIDGFVLTKIDTDTKGGTAISLLYKLKKPIVFVGTGQRYEDLLEFKSEFIIDRIL
ncbi:MAG: signal recognition particle-docking protein FtsY [Candidatus Diapherotrites archaeon]|uniref:Signal recognition particle-docking protein FtsY n=1 Tax=Candidatus Iainarchaeum sp. TaxID=3101447 RepID=A0A2D6LQ62_9ARCH|nr:signal recognition particle-docking protein FtsY [Candidatus Diapherotrites archaeon]|tara:strand:- start:22546 stop:23805 length:1260 start_codon:yes stop_codon:yes gene_type:complete